MSGPLRLRVVSFNIHSGRPASGPVDLPAIARVLRDLNPDLVGLQEVSCRLPPGGFLDQVTLLRELLEMEVVFGRCFGAGPCAYGNAVLSRVPPDQVRRLRLPGAGTPRAVLRAMAARSEAPVRHRWRRVLDAAEPRGLLDLRFTLDGRAVRLLNTHLCLSPEERREQVHFLEEELWADELPTIALGDWNATPQSPEIRALEAAGLVHCSPETVSTYPSHAPVVRIDYIMATPHFQVERGWAVATTASDHLPVVADLLLP